MLFGKKQSEQKLLTQYLTKGTRGVNNIIDSDVKREKPKEVIIGVNEPVHYICHLSIASERKNQFFGKKT